MSGSTRILFNCTELFDEKQDIQHHHRAAAGMPAGLSESGSVVLDV
jgi:hypothetical protein